MRLSSSLQDFSAYCNVDTREAELDLQIDRSYSRAKPFRFLERGGISSFSKERALPSSPVKRKKWMRAALCFGALLLLLLLLYVCLRYGSTYFSNKASNYYVILDCGSTGTRVYVFEGSIDRSKTHVNLPIVMRSLPGSHKTSTIQSGRAYQRMETEPGFGKLVHNESGLRAAIKPLLHWAEKQIPNHVHRTTPLFVYATAGVRKLPASDSEWILSKTWSILKNSSFLCRKEWVKIVSGMEEAYYGWIALNYHMGMLGSLPPKETIGALDLGGSSLQVTFETQKPIQDDTSINMSIGAVNHHLSAYSLTGYGLNDAFDKSVARLLRRLLETSPDALNKGHIELEHPCLQTGYREKYICSLCSVLGNDVSPQIGGHRTWKAQPGLAVELLGRPQWEECSALAKIAVNLSEWSNVSGINCKEKPCALAHGFPKPQGQFYAMSGFYVVYRFFNLSSAASLNDVLHKGEEFCGKTWEIARRSVPPQPFIEQYCFRAPYVVSLLRDGLHIPDKNLIVGSGSITWTLGVALLEAGQSLPSRIKFQSFRMLRWNMNSAIFLLLFVSLILLYFALSCATKGKPKFFRRSLLPLFRHNSATASKSNIQSPFSLRWSPINAGDGRTKMPLSPTIAGSEQHPFSNRIQLTDASLNPLGFNVSHSYSSGSLGQMQFGSGTGSFMTPLRGQTTLQSRRSQSREDLNSSLESHMTKV